MRRKLLIILLGAVIVAGLGFLYLNALPRIYSVSPVAFVPGQKILLTGESFGTRESGNFVELDGSPLSSSSYLTWRDDAVEITLPYSVDSGLLRVSTRLGKSNPCIVAAKSGIPAAPDTAMQAVSMPTILSISPDALEVGGLLEIEGIHFGTNAQFSSILFSRNIAAGRTGGQSSPIAAVDDAPALNFLELTEKDGLYERWDDKKISVRVPEGVGTGALMIRTPQGDSAPFSMAVKQGSGTKFLFDPAIFSVQFNIDIEVKSMAEDGSILVYAPNPVSTSSQTLDAIQEEHPEPYLADYYRMSVFRIQAIDSPRTRIERNMLLTVSGVETDLSRYNGTFRDGLIPEFLKQYLAQETLIPAADKDVTNLALKLVGKEKNLQRKAQLIWNWMNKNIVWSAGSQKGQADSAVQALKAKRADTRQFNLLGSALFRAAGIPAVPLSGFILKKDGTAIPHAWMEYFLPTVGWIPFDPVLAQGNRPEGFDAGFSESSPYFGSLDNRHLAVTRGIEPAAPLLRKSLKKTSGIAWSMQTVFEESDGRTRYSSTWEDMELLGTY